MEKEERKVDSIQLLADIQECCKKHGMKIALLEFKDEFNNKNTDNHPFQLVNIEICCVYKTPKENLTFEDVEK